jgi:hypothetical protein
MGWLCRAFTPSKSDNQSGAQYNEVFNATSTPAPVLPPAPTADDSKAKAAEEIARMKRMRAMAGGKTILTSEAPVLTSGGSGKTLLGS